MHKTKVSRAVAQLEQRKFVARRANRADLREAFLSLTPAGRAVYEELAPSALEFMERLSEVVAPADRAAFDRAMKQLTKRSAELVAESRTRQDRRLEPPAQAIACGRTAALARRTREALHLFPLVRGLPGAHRAQSQGPRQRDRSRSICRRKAAINRKPEYRAINPQMRVPALQARHRRRAHRSRSRSSNISTRSIPQPPLLPRDPVARAKVRALAQLIACDIHPLNNVAPLRYLKNELGQEQAKIDAWYHHWVIDGFDALEAMIAPAPMPSAAR